MSLGAPSRGHLRGLVPLHPLRRGRGVSLGDGEGSRCETMWPPTAPALSVSDRSAGMRWDSAVRQVLAYLGDPFHEGIELAGPSLLVLGFDIARDGHRDIGPRPARCQRAVSSASPTASLPSGANLNALVTLSHRVRTWAQRGGVQAASSMVCSWLAGR